MRRWTRRSVSAGYGSGSDGDGGEEQDKDDKWGLRRTGVSRTREMVIQKNARESDTQLNPSPDTGPATPASSIAHRYRSASVQIPSPLTKFGHQPVERPRTMSEAAKHAGFILGHRMPRRTLLPSMIHSASHMGIEFSTTVLNTQIYLPGGVSTHEEWAWHTRTKTVKASIRDLLLESTNTPNGYDADDYSLVIVSRLPGFTGSMTLEPEDVKISEHPCVQHCRIHRIIPVLSLVSVDALEELDEADHDLRDEVVRLVGMDLAPIDDDEVNEFRESVRDFLEDQEQSRLRHRRQSRDPRLELAHLVPMSMRGEVPVTMCKVVLKKKLSSIKTAIASERSSMRHSGLLEHTRGDADNQKHLEQQQNRIRPQLLHCAQSVMRLQEDFGFLSNLEPDVPKMYTVEVRSPIGCPFSTTLVELCTHPSAEGADGKCTVDDAILVALRRFVCKGIIDASSAWPSSAAEETATAAAAAAAVTTSALVAATPSRSGETGAVRESPVKYCFKVTGFNEYLFGPAPLLEYMHVRRKLNRSRKVQMTLVPVSSIDPEFMSAGSGHMDESITSSWWGPSTPSTSAQGTPTSSPRATHTGVPSLHGGIIPSTLTSAFDAVGQEAIESTNVRANDDSSSSMRSNKSASLLQDRPHASRPAMTAPASQPLSSLVAAMFPSLTREASDASTGVSTAAEVPEKSNTGTEGSRSLLSKLRRGSDHDKPFRRLSKVEPPQDEEGENEDQNGSRSSKSSDFCEDPVPDAVRSESLSKMVRTFSIDRRTSLKEKQKRLESLRSQRLARASTTEILEDDEGSYHISEEDLRSESGTDAAPDEAPLNPFAFAAGSSISVVSANGTRTVPASTAHECTHVELAKTESAAQDRTSSTSGGINFGSCHGSHMEDGIESISSGDGDGKPESVNVQDIAGGLQTGFSSASSVKSPSPNAMLGSSKRGLNYHQASSDSDDEGMGKRSSAEGMKQVHKWASRASIYDPGSLTMKRMLTSTRPADSHDQAPDDVNDSYQNLEDTSTSLADVSGRVLRIHVLGCEKVYRAGCDDDGKSFYSTFMRRFEGIKGAADTTRGITLGVRIELWFGEQRLCPAQATSDVSLRCSPRWNTWLSFDIELPNLPQGARMCSSLVAKIPGHDEEFTIAWVNTPLVDRQGFLRHGIISQRMFQDGQADPLGSCSEKYSDPDAVQLYVKFDSFTAPLRFPSREEQIEYGQTLTVPALLAKPSSSRGVVSLDTDGNTCREKLSVALAKHPLEPLTQEEKDLIWMAALTRWRIAWTPKRVKALPKLLRSVNWAERKMVAMTYVLLSEWPLMSPWDALELFSVKFANPEVDKVAVESLAKLSDSHLLDLLPQLVQVLKSDTYLDSHLARFLLARGIRDAWKVGHHLFWLLKAEMHEPQTSNRFGIYLTEFVQALTPRCRHVLSNECAFKDAVLSVAKSVAGIEQKSQRNQAARGQLQEHQSQFPPYFVLPLGCQYYAAGLVVEKSRAMDSKKVPLWLTFSSMEKDSSDLQGMFKTGDDLRQDVITLQMIRIMDRQWQNEGLLLCMSPYEVVATGDSEGVIEIVQDAVTYCSITLAAGGPSEVWNTKRVDEWISAQNPTPYLYGKAVDTFMRSTAGYCVATYVLGIGDRHDSNIMLTKRGHLFHIDFGHFLGHFKDFKKIPGIKIKRETSPFVFTPDWAHVMRKNEKYDTFLNLCCRAFVVLRRNASLYINMFAMMMSTGIPELTCEADIQYMIDTMMLDKSDEEAQEELKSLIRLAEKNSRKQWDSYAHCSKHSKS